MPKHHSHRWFIIVILVVGMLTPAAGAFARNLQESVSAYQLIASMNSLRVSYGNGSLAEDAIVDAVAQATAETMAANEMSWHIGNVSGRLASSGYGGGATVWATENFAVGLNMTLADIMSVWSDASHMLPATTAAYCNVGAGVAVAPNGMTYYVLQAAYVAGKSCGSYTSGSGSTSGNTDGTGGSTAVYVPQIVYPVEVATPDADGHTYHLVRDGQSLWAIAIAYHVTIKDLESYNNLSNDSIQIGQKLFIPNSSTAGYFTPTPVGMVIISTPDASGKIVHVVEAYQTLSTISLAYDVSIDTIVALNGIQQDTILQIGQNLLIKPGVPTPTATTRPFNPLEILTPISEGQYYYIVKNGENLSYIATLFGVKLTDFMAWNGLNEISVIRPGDKLVMKLAIPPTETPSPTSIPPTASPTTSHASLTPARTVALTVTSSPTETPASDPIQSGKTAAIWVVAVGLAACGVSLVTWMARNHKFFFKGKRNH